MNVRQIRVGPMANFVYLIVDDRTRKAAVVDSGWEVEPIVKEAESAGAKVLYVIGSHGHFDHVATVHELASKLGAEVVVHSASQLESDRKVVHGERLGLGEKVLEFLHTPGHTEDSVCVYDGMNLFTGDTLFIGTVGRFDPGSSRIMFRSLHEVILGLPDDTEVYPGHDYGPVPHRSLGLERRENPFLSVSDFRRFLSIAG